MGKLVVIEGLDGSGKATQTALLAERLAKLDIDARVVSFPDYKSHSSALVRMYLGGDFGTKADDVNAYAASSFYAVDRYASYMKDWRGYYNGGGVVLADRYTTSNIIHQCAKLPAGEWAGFVGWLEDYEYVKLGIPRPGLVLCLDVEPSVSQKLLLKRYDGAKVNDIHEQDLDYLERCREVARWSEQANGWTLIPCTENGDMRPKETITDILEKLVLEHINR